MGSASSWKYILIASLPVSFFFFFFNYGLSPQIIVEHWSLRPGAAAANCDNDNVPTTVTATVTASSSPTHPPSNPYRDLSPEDFQGDYSKTLVIATLETEDVNWIHDDLSEMLEPDGSMKLALYVVDKLDADLHPPVNKGHEAMVYLTYIIQHYDKLPDVSIFMHSHGITWHNNDILDQSSAQIVRRLNVGKVVREGYMNLRCHWAPGCPTRMHLDDMNEDINKKEQREMAKAFQEIFPDEPLPSVLAQACCAQFAVSRESIRSRTKEKYIAVRDWLLATQLEDDISGRVFEYLWQYLFISVHAFCPDTHVCLCDGYGVCWPSADAYMQYTDLQDGSNAMQQELDQWREKRDRYDEAKENPPEDEEMPEAPEEGREDVLQGRIDGLTAELERRRKVAFEIGEDPGRRLEVLVDIWDDMMFNTRSFNNPLGSG